MTSKCSIKVSNLPEPRLPATHSMRVERPKTVFPKTPPPKQFTRWDKNKDQIVIAMIKEGKKRHEIAAEFGITLSSLHKRIQRMRQRGAEI